MNVCDDIEVCAECGTPFDHSDRYLPTPDGYTCSFDCYTDYILYTSNTAYTLYLDDLLYDESIQDYKKKDLEK